MKKPLVQTPLWCGLVVLILAACGGPGGPGGSDSKLVESIVINETPITLAVGETKELTVTVQPPDADNKTVSWSSNNSPAATVSAGGLVTAIAEGTATVSATARDGSGKSGSVLVTVTADGGSAVLVTSVTVSPATVSLETGKTSQLTVAVEPSNATDKTVTWSSSNQSAATVDANGLVTAVAVSSAPVTITATARDGSGKSGSASVTVSLPSDVTPVTSITIDSSSVPAAIYPGDTFSLSVTVEPSNATDKTVTWSSSNQSVATVNANGLVTAVAPGTAAITAATNDGSGKSAAYSVTVSPVLVTSVTLNESSLILIPTWTSQLTASVSPSTATNKTVTWSSGNQSVATVSANGLVTAVAPGTAAITAAVNDGSGKSASCTVTVKSGAGLEINFEGFTDQNIDLTKDRNNDLSRHNNDSLTVTVSGVWDSIAWDVDGQGYGSSANSYQVEASWYPANTTHYITVVVKTGGSNPAYYSKELSFRVVE
jgi:uncharacterized protein YjdB